MSLHEQVDVIGHDLQRHHPIPEIADATCGHLHLPVHAGDNTHRLCQTTRFPRRPKDSTPLGGA